MLDLPDSEEDAAAAAAARDVQGVMPRSITECALLDDHYASPSRARSPGQPSPQAHPASPTAALRDAAAVKRARTSSDVIATTTAAGPDGGVRGLPSRSHSKSSAADEPNTAPAQGPLNTKLPYNCILYCEMSVTGWSNAGWEDGLQSQCRGPLERLVGSCLQNVPRHTTQACETATLCLLLLAYLFVVGALGIFWVQSDYAQTTRDFCWALAVFPGVPVALPFVGLGALVAHSSNLARVFLSFALAGLVNAAVFVYLGTRSFFAQRLSLPFGVLFPAGLFLLTLLTIVSGNRVLAHISHRSVCLCVFNCPLPFILM
jgi:hypothetical protein